MNDELENNGLSEDFINDGLPDNFVISKLVTAKLREMSTEQQKKLTEDLLKNFSPIVNRATKEINRKLAATGKAGIFREALNSILGESASIYYEITGDLEPFINKELQKPEYNGATIKDLLNQYEIKDLAHLPEDSTLLKVIEAARAAKADRKNLPRIAARAVTEYPVTLDKMNTIVVFDFLRNADPDGQITMLPVREESNNAPALTSYYSLAFSDDLPPEIKKKLTPYDRLVYGGAAAVQEQNGNIMSISQIHRAMGNKRPPNKTQYKKIHDSLLKMNYAHADINCLEVRDKYSNEGYIDWHGSLFPMEIVRAFINGQLVEGAICILRHELPLISLAKGRNHQLGKVPTALLDSKLSQTDANIAMEFYTLEQLLKIKNPKSRAHNKILYSKIYEKMGAKTDKQKQRAKKAFFTYLDELKDKKFITAYKEETTKSTGEIGVKFEY